MLMLIPLGLFSQDTLLFRSGRVLNAKVISEGDRIKFNTVDEFDATHHHKLKQRDLSGIHYANGSIRNFEMESGEREKIKSRKGYPITNLGPYSRDAYGFIAESRILSIASVKKSKEDLTAEIKKTKKARNIQHAIQLTAGVQFAAGISLASFAARSTDLSSVQMAGILCVLIAVPVEGLSVIPFVIHQIHFHRVVKMYDACILEELK